MGAFADGLLNLLLIIGRPGVQKSHAVKAAVGRRACWIDGSATAFGLYCQLYRHRDRPVVIDDVDGLYADRAAASSCVRGWGAPKWTQSGITIAKGRSPMACRACSNASARPAWLG